LGRFELAWHAYDAGDVHEALELFREVIADKQLMGSSAGDPWATEAVVRAAEIIGRHAEIRGDTKTAAELYRHIVKLDGSGIVARRLLLMLWREGRIQEAAELAPRVLRSDGNLAQHLCGSDVVDQLTRWVRHEARRQPTTAGGQDAGNIRLQAR
jgi:hypothetical protein